MEKEIQKLLEDMQMWNDNDLKNLSTEWKSVNRECGEPSLIELAEFELGKRTVR